MNSSRVKSSCGARVLLLFREVDSWFYLPLGRRTWPRGPSRRWRCPRPWRDKWRWNSCKRWGSEAGTGRERPRSFRIPWRSWPWDSPSLWSSRQGSRSSPTGGCSSARHRRRAWCPRRRFCPSSNLREGPVKSMMSIKRFEFRTSKDLEVQTNRNLCSSWRDHPHWDEYHSREGRQRELTTAPSSWKFDDA